MPTDDNEMKDAPFGINVVSGSHEVVCRTCGARARRVGGTCEVCGADLQGLFAIAAKEASIPRRLFRRLSSRRSPAG